jgi:4a-hydroxytetrahydrobiopterin dehydratase
MPTPLTESELQAALSELHGWRHEDNKLKKELEFGDFQEAIGFIVRLAFHAEAQDHHPELFNVYNRVNIELTTHDAGNKVTAKDVTLARSVETLLS